MKYLFSFLFLICLLHVGKAFSQETSMNLDVTISKKHGSFMEGEKVKFISLTHKLTGEDDFGRIYDTFYLTDSKDRTVEITNKMDKFFIFNYSDVQSVWDSYIITNVLHFYEKKGFQDDLRREVSDEATQYLSDLKSYGLEFEDPYLRTYLYSLIYKIAPRRLLDGGRLQHLNLLIKKDCTLNACTFPNGTIVITTGLLASLHSEDELVAVLAHEIAHFVLDHTVINISKAETRQKRAEFWSAFATGVTAVAEGVAAAKHDYYMPGMATLGMAALSTSIAASVIERMGMNYNHEQEYVADQVAFYILIALGYDGNALATVLTRIEQHYIEQHDYRIYFESFSHPMLDDRIKAIGVYQNIIDKKYEQLVSFAITEVAATNYYLGKFTNCLELVRQNIDNNVATSDDYLLAANCLLNLSDNVESNQECRRMIDSAKIVDSSNINCYKVEILLLLRLGEYQSAYRLLEHYYGALAGKMNIENPAMNDVIKEYRFDFVSGEQKWAKKMLCKLKGMMSTN